MKQHNPKVDAYLRRAKSWQDELAVLRKIVLATELIEELKWRQPCYTLDGKNVVILGSLKDFCTLSFFKGVLLQDSQQLLRQPGKSTQSGRFLPFASVAEIRKQKPIIKAYLEEAIELERAGKKVTFKKNPEPVPPELQQKFEESSEFDKAFHALTPGRQRGYILYFSAPKQSKTRAARIEKYTDRILNGIGFHDEYRAARKQAAGKRK